MSFLSSLRFLVPSWLYDEITQSHAMILDEYADRARAGLEARFPSRAQPDALALIGADRGIPRGRTETDAHYAQRLIGWRFPRGHRVRGSAFALLNQVSEYFGGVDCTTVDYKGTIHTRTAAGVESFSYGSSWTWDADTTLKARFWITITPGALMTANPPLGDAALWGGTLGTPGYAIGQIGAVRGDVDAMRALFTGDCPWKPAGTRQQWLIVNLDNTSHTPDATWVHWSKVVAGVRSASRYTGWRYWSLFPGLNQYSGNADNATGVLLLPDGTSYTANALAATTTTITLPDGTSYVPNPANAKALVDLVDDGDQP